MVLIARYLSECQKPFVLGEADCACAAVEAMRPVAPALAAALNDLKRHPAYAANDAWTMAYVAAFRVGARVVPATEEGPAWGLACFGDKTSIAIRGDRAWWTRGHHGPVRVPARRMVIAWECV